MTVRKTRLLDGVVIFSIVLLAACQQANQSANESLQLAPISPAADVVVSNQSPSDETSNLPQASVVQPLEQRVVLKDASLQIVVENVAATLDSITKMAEDMGGWIINSNTSKSSRVTGDDAITGSIAIRVPATQFTVAVTRIKDQSISVDSETVTGTDVTQEYTDLNSQVTNLQAAEKQLQTILDSANTTDDVLKIYNELVRVRGEIETTQGRINYYKEASSFSSISVALRPPTVAQASVQVDTGWSPVTTVKGAFNALVNILQALANLLIILVVLILPLVLVIGIPAWIVYKLLRRYGWIKNQSRISDGSNPPSNTKIENDVG